MVRTPFRKGAVQAASAAPNPAPWAETFPLSPEYQTMLLRVLLEDRGFGGHVAPHIRPSYFVNPSHRWAWQVAAEYHARYGALPTLHWVANLAAQLPEGQREVTLAGLTQVRDTPVLDRTAMEEAAMDFLRQAVFRQGHLDSRDLFNAGRLREAYTVMRDAMTALDEVGMRKASRGWLAEQFRERVMQRAQAPETRFVTTGYPELDRRFGGGVYPGFLGIWLAYPKAGKSTILVNHGAVAMRLGGKRVFHAVLEGSRSYIEERYDALLSGEDYAAVRRGHMDAIRYGETQSLYNRMRGLCVVQDYTQSMEPTVLNIMADLRELENNHGWRPDLIIVDYADLLRGRNPPYRSEQEVQKEAVSDLKKLATQGYAVWTASQVQRPRDVEYESSQHTLTSASIADCYAKVRIADFVGSLNQTTQEKAQNVMRLYAELYRDGPAHAVIPIHADFTKMVFGAQAAAAAPPTGAPHADRAAPQQKPLGYAGLQQSRPGGGGHGA